MEKLTPLKQGDTLDLTWSLPLTFGATVDTVEASVATAAGVAVDDLTVTTLPDDATYSNWRIYAAPAVTALWPVGNLICDIKHTVSSDVTRSDTFRIPVVAAVTP